MIQQEDSMKYKQYIINTNGSFLDCNLCQFEQQTIQSVEEPRNVLQNSEWIDTPAAHSYWVVANLASYELQFSNAFRHLVLFVFFVQCIFAC